jgi:hypothetical protein
LSIELPRCTAIKFDENINLIAAGFSDGYIVVFEIKNKSPIKFFSDNDLKEITSLK